MVTSFSGNRTYPTIFSDSISKIITENSSDNEETESNAKELKPNNIHIYIGLKSVKLKHILELTADKGSGFIQSSTWNSFKKVLNIMFPDAICNTDSLISAHIDTTERFGFRENLVSIDSISIAVDKNIVLSMFKYYTDSLEIAATYFIQVLLKVLSNKYDLLFDNDSRANVSISGSTIELIAFRYPLLTVSNPKPIKDEEDSSEGVKTDNNYVYLGVDIESLKEFLHIADSKTIEFLKGILETDSLSGKLSM